MKLVCEKIFIENMNNNFQKTKNSAQEIAEKLNQKNLAQGTYKDRSFWEKGLGICQKLKKKYSKRPQKTAKKKSSWNMLLR